MVSISTGACKDKKGYLKLVLIISLHMTPNSKHYALKNHLFWEYIRSNILIRKKLQAIKTSQELLPNNFKRFTIFIRRRTLSYICK